jgi:hypothetical protein
MFLVSSAIQCASFVFEPLGGHDNHVNDRHACCYCAASEEDGYPKDDGKGARTSHRIMYGTS